MYQTVSPPKFKYSYVGGSNSSLKATATSASHSTSNPNTLENTNSTTCGSGNFGEKSTCRLNSLQSVNSAGSSTSLLSDVYKKHATHYSPNRQQGNYGGRTSRTTKRGKKTWGNKDRAGMSFLIVIAFFAVFGLIILTEIFMIDERAHAGMVALRHGSVMGRLGDSMPDYDNVKEDYDLLEDNLLKDHKLGFVQVRDNKFKIQEADASSTGRIAGVLLNSGGVGGGLAAGGMSIGVATGFNVPIIPWGKILPSKIEETLPHFPFGLHHADGSWQVVNGTRFKFFVFSAFYDRRQNENELERRSLKRGDGVKLVRVIGATKTRGPERVWCRFWYSSRHNLTHGERENSQHHYKSVTVMARVKVIRENWNLKYSACFVLCPVRVPELQVPDYISVVSRLRTPPGNLLLVRNTDWDADFTSSSRSTNTSTILTVATPLLRNSTVVVPPLDITSSENIPDRIAVCVKPFHFNYDQPLFLMEYIEFYALLGVSHFTFYNHTIGPHATCVLQHYVQGDIPVNLTAYDLEPPTAADFAAKFDSSAGFTTKPPRHLDSSNYVRPTVEILPWNLRMRSQKEIRTEGLFAALNDCVYRSMYRYKYLALVDLDEFIIPRHNDTLNELIESLNQRFRNRNTGAYSFQNAFYYLQFPDDPMVRQPTSLKNVDPRIRSSLVTQRKTKRRFKLHPQKQRSKYICKPEAVVEAGNHFVWEFSPNKGSLNVPPTEAILQHYRVCEFGGNDCIKAPSIIDRTATKYINRLVQRVDLVYKHLKHTCQLPNLPPPAAESSATLSSQTNNENKNPNEIKMNASTKKLLLGEFKKNPSNTKSQYATTLEQQQPTNQINNLTRTKAVRQKRKLVVFEPNAAGVVKARVQFEHKTQG